MGIIALILFFIGGAMYHCNRREASLVSATSMFLFFNIAIQARLLYVSIFFLCVLISLVVVYYQGGINKINLEDQIGGTD